MKSLRSIAIGLGMLFATVSAAQAQEVRVKADVPFAFTVGGKELPAGNYFLTSSGVSDTALVIRNEDQNATALTVTNSCRKLDPASSTKLVFHRVGDQYFLYQIWTEGNSAGRQLRAPAAEKMLAQNHGVETVIVAANLASR